MATESGTRPPITEAAPDWITADALNQAMDAGQLYLVYQPKVALPSGALAGVEALLRWRHPEHGTIPPTPVVAAAERLNAMDRLTSWVLDSALAQWARWRDTGLVTSCSVNMSPLNLDRADFPDHVAALCAKYGVATRHITIELTETAAQHALRLMETLTRFRLKGLRLALDDFGVGYSSLAQLAKLPFSEIKIDKCFVTDAPRSRDARVIVKSIIDLAHNLGLHATAEGIETPEVMQMLIDYGCDEAQGYFISRPMAGDALPDWIAASPERSPVTP